MPTRTPESSPSEKSPDAKSGASLVSSPSLSLPKGGGAVRGIDEKFSVNPSTGTASLSVPLPISPGRSGFSPSLSLFYDSGSGNGPFGLGWSLSLPAISRKTEKTLPRYRDGEDSDVFLLSGAEDLVPSLKTDGTPDAFSRDGFSVRRYRPRIEGLFARIERWTDAAGDAHWRSMTKDNATSVYGRSPSARLSDPSDPGRVYKWLLEETRDDRGNVVRYEYKPEDASGVLSSDVFEKNRLPGTFANTHLKRIFYGNKTPSQPDGWHFQAVFDYGDHDTDVPTPTEVRAWPRRADSFSFNRAGFDVRTHRLCRRVLMFHVFDELGTSPCLVRSLDIQYREDAAATRLVSVVQSGYLRNDSGYSKKSLPPLEFAYTEAEMDEEVHFLEAGSLENLPEGLAGSRYQWVDLDGEGLSGVLTEEGGAWRYKRNLGGGTLAPLELVSARPSPGLSGGAQLLDLANEGRKSLVQFSMPAAGYFGRDGEGGWGPFTPFPSALSVSFKDSNRRFLDLNGDGMADVLMTEDDVLSWHPSLGKEGFGAREWVLKPRDEEKGPAVVFADQEQSIYLADMSGGGLADIVRVRNGEICYWPNLGYGHFGTKVTMAGAPVFDSPDQFSQARIRLADIDGTGPADLIYLGRDETQYWTNLSGNGWSAPRTITAFPRSDNTADAAVVDLLGNGTACLVWSSLLPGDARRPLCYIDLMGGVKPHLLASVKNNLGAETRVQYSPSTKFYVQDAAAGAPWVTKLPFPVQVVERAEVYDHVTGTRFVAAYSYHHGYYDGPEQEFRGFGRVDQTDTEEYEAFQGAGLFPKGTNALEAPLHVPPVLVRTWFHTGAFLDGERVSARFAREYWQDDLHPQAAPFAEPALPPGLTTPEQIEAVRALKGSLLRQEVYALDGTANAGRPFTVSQRSYHIQRVQALAGNPHAVFLVSPSETLDFQYERDPDDPRVGHQLVLETDLYGQVLKSAAVGYPRRAPQSAEQTTRTVVCAEVDLINVDDQPAWRRVSLPLEDRSYEAVPPPPEGARYEVEELRQALAGLVSVPFESAAVPGTKRLLSRGRSIYLKNDLSGALPPGQVESLALPDQRYTAVFTPGLVAQAYGGRVTDAMLSDEGKYVLQDGLWWAPSGRQDFSPAQFYLPVRSRDVFGNVASVFYDEYALLPVRTESSQDAVLNSVVTVENDYRLLSAAVLTDANGSRSAIRADELGMVIASAAMGREGMDEGDTLDDPTMRLEYDFFQWVTDARPICVRAFAREQHGPSNPRWQESREYSDGFGRVVQKKVQAEPAPGTALPRWVGTGRTVVNNKGAPVKQYESFFSGTPDYEDEAALVASGVTPILRYDAVGRLVRTDKPDGSFSTTVFDSWRQESWDANDTVLDSLWYSQRGAPDPAGPEPSDPEVRAAWLAARHAGTPGVVHSDALGRKFLSILDDGPLGLFETRTALDIQGNSLSVTDASGRVVMAHRYDMLQRAVYQTSMDAGERWIFQDAANKPLRSWDEGGRRFRTVYDGLSRPVLAFAGNGNGPDVLMERTVFGEWKDDPAANLHGRVYRHYDGAGESTAERYDFKGNLLSSRRRLANDHTPAFNWNALDGLTALADIEAAAQFFLEEQAFSTVRSYDALDRVTGLTAPDSSLAVPTYNEANKLENLSVHIRGAADPTVFVANVDYDAKGRRTRIDYGNGARTDYSYDALSFRLTGLSTTRPGAVLQDLSYAFDPAGNITGIRDSAQQTVYFNNAVVAPGARYRYDAIYRLVHAEGREHRGQGASPQVDHDDSPRMGQPQPGDGPAMRNYAEDYEYDPAGNILKMIHVADQGNWTLRYRYAADSNRLLGTSLPGDPDGTFSAVYQHDSHGNMTAMPHLSEITWNEKDQMCRVDLGGGGTAYYVYDAAGQRTRKVIVSLQGLVKERIYLDGWEVYRERINGVVVLERQTLHVMDDKRRIALLDTETVGPDSVKTVTRYQFGDHLGSAGLELDEEAAVISYEEYRPYGSTSYQAGRSAAEVALKRYRFTGKERDDETSLSYHGARYYAPWLGRWTAADPAGASDGLNAFLYGHANPVVFVDPNGRENVPVSSQDFQIKDMKDPQLFDFLHALSPEDRAAFATKATGAFAGRAWAMLDKYEMKRIFVLPEVTLLIEKEKPKPSSPPIDPKMIIGKCYLPGHEPYHPPPLEPQRQPDTIGPLTNPGNGTVIGRIGGKEVWRGTVEEANAGFWLVQQTGASTEAEFEYVPPMRPSYDSSGDDDDIVWSMSDPAGSAVKGDPNPRRGQKLNLEDREAHVYEIRWRNKNTGETGVFKFGVSRQENGISPAGDSVRAAEQINKWNRELVENEIPFELYQGQIWGEGYNNMKMNSPQAHWAEGYKVKEHEMNEGFAPPGNQSPRPWRGPNIRPVPRAPVRTIPMERMETEVIE